MIRGSFALALVVLFASLAHPALGQTTEPKPAPPQPPPGAGTGAGKPKAPPATKPGKAAPTPQPSGGEEAPTPPPSAPPPETTPPAGEGTENAAPNEGAEAAPGAVRPTAPTTGLPSEPARPPIGIFPRSQSDLGTASAETGQQRREPEHKAGEEVFAEDWWSHARPVFEIHGYFRTRGELLHNFSLGRLDNPAFAVWPQPADNSYKAEGGQSYGPQLCTPAEAGIAKDLDNPANGLVPCSNKTQTGANMRFRLDPELHVSDNLRVISQVDLLDNVVLGSTPSGYSFQPAGGTNGGYQVNARGGYYANGVFDDTIVPPTAGVNALSNSIVVKRVWAEYSTPVGELRFGRMPDHFGLGMVHNSGDGYDDDYQSTVDRIQFITAIKPLDLYLGASWDFPNEGYIVQAPIPGGQAHDSAQLDDVNQWSLIIMRKQSPELVKLALAHEQVVVNGGGYLTLRKQLLADDQSGTAALASSGANVPNATTADVAIGNTGFSRIDATIWEPDLWFQLRYKKFRFETEGAAVLGSMESTNTTPGPVNPATFNTSGRNLRQFGFASELEQKLVEDKLRLGFNFGWASGDADAFNPNSTNNLVPEAGQRQINDDTISTFRFHPAYRIDLILNRSILQRIQGTYYVKPSVEYDFMRKPTGQRLGGGAGIIWTRASEFVQAPGHARDLGIELDGRLYFQSKDGSLNDQPEKKGGFFAMLEYGVLFPLAGMGYPPIESAKIGGADVSAAQILRLYLGVLF